MVRLYGCPFCGGKVNMVYNSFDKAFKFYHVIGEDSLACPIIEPIMLEAESLADAAERWNRRVNDADALIQVLNRERVPVDLDVNYFIMNAPTVDAVPVVRCRDCKWGKTWKNGVGIEGFKCDLMCVDLSPEAFCSYGERRGEDG